MDTKITNILHDVFICNTLKAAPHSGIANQSGSPVSHLRLYSSITSTFDGSKSRHITFFQSKNVLKAFKRL
jgi:hypothetical protein